jgi:E3 ubiquitin-protein ligase SIS3
MATEICSFLWKNNVLSVLVLLLYPFLWVWTVIGTLWFSTARGCVSSLILDIGTTCVILYSKFY